MNRQIDLAEMHFPNGPQRVIERLLAKAKR
jgi:hypothetical protein